MIQDLNMVASNEGSLGFSQPQISMNEMLTVTKYKWIWGYGPAAQADEPGDMGIGYGHRMVGGQVDRRGI